VAVSLLGALFFGTGISRAELTGYLVVMIGILAIASLVDDPERAPPSSKPSPSSPKEQQLQPLVSGSPRSESASPRSGGGARGNGGRALEPLPKSVVVDVEDSQLGSAHDASVTTTLLRTSGGYELRQASAEQNGLGTASKSKPHSPRGRGTTYMRTSPRLSPKGSGSIIHQFRLPDPG